MGATRGEGDDDEPTSMSHGMSMMSVEGEERGEHNEGHARRDNLGH